MIVPKGMSFPSTAAQKVLAEDHAEQVILPYDTLFNQ
jgi:hypothetical protein